MAKLKPLKKDKAYTAINGWMDVRFDRIDAYSFYRLLFPEGELETQQERDERKPGKYGAIVNRIAIGENSKRKHVRRYTLTDDLDALGEIITSNDFCVMPPISYAGQSATAANARKLYAIAIDLDNIAERDGRPQGLDQLFYQIENRDFCPSPIWLPQPTAIVSSGTGVHIYWMLKEPVRLFPHIVKQLREMRRQLTRKVWHEGASADYSDDKIQYEGIYQGLRMVGSITKLGRRVVAWQTGEPVSITELNKYVDEAGQVDNAADAQAYNAKYTLAEARKMWPTWYQERIVEHQPRKTWTCNKALYRWWLRKARDADVGHRYFAMMCLSVYAIKCGVSFDELEQDLADLADWLDLKSPDDGTNSITAGDVHDALNAYTESYHTFPINSIVYLSGLPIEKNKRNHRPRSVHVKLMKSISDVLYPNGEWRNKNGRPKGSGKQEIVQKWRAAHPDGRKIDCQRETGLSRPTIIKWWNC